MDKQIEAIHEAFLRCEGLSTDSRECGNNSMFCALKGERFDGNVYVEDVLSKGASFAISDNKDLANNAKVFVVNDTLKALQDLALFHRRYLGIPIVAITGTNGKTTTKELVAAVLSKKFKLKATAGNFNNHIGVPLTLLSMDKSLQMGIVEMGANHIGEIDFLCRIAEPNYGLITNVGKAHLEGFGSFEGVKETKGELYRYIQKAEGSIFINADNVHLIEMAKGVEGRITYGCSAGEITGKAVRNNPFLSLEWGVNKDDVNAVDTNLIGAYNLENILASIAIGHYFGVATVDINTALSEYEPTNNRSQFIKTEKNQIIMDAYNANPSSMKVAVQNFAQVNEDNKVLVLGGMKELGKDSLHEHKELIDLIASSNFNRVLYVGDEFASLLQDTDDYYADSDALIEQLKKHPLKAAYVLIKGSRSNKLEQLLSYL